MSEKLPVTSSTTPVVAGPNAAEQRRPQPRGGIRGEPHPEFTATTEQPRQHEQHSRVGHAVQQGGGSQPGHELRSGEGRHEQARLSRGPAVRLVRGGQPRQRGVELPGLRDCGQAHHGGHRETRSESGAPGGEDGLHEAGQERAGEGDARTGDERPGVQRPHRAAT